MSIIFELYKTSGKKVCPPNYVRKSNCPLIVRTTSEDLLTANVFGILKNLDPKIWLRRFLGEAIKEKDFSKHTFEDLSFEFWKRYRPPLNRKYREGISEVDVTISFKDGIIFIEAKYLAPVSLKTTNDVRRDQVIRYLDLAAYHFLNHPDSVKEFYFVLIMDTDKPPWVLTRYRYNQNLIKGLTNPGFFKPTVDIGSLLSKGLGWLSWNQLKKILEVNKLQFRTPVERRFVEDLIVYLDYKIREGERIRTERKQLSFW
jgi:Holliday junction resolvase-like predicted endonuclease